jgi:hypothetical protein
MDRRKKERKVNSMWNWINLSIKEVISKINENNNHKKKSEFAPNNEI